MLGQELEAQWDPGISTLSQRREELIFFFLSHPSWRSADPLLGINQDDIDARVFLCQGKGKDLPRVQGSADTERYAGSLNDCNKTAWAPGAEVGGLPLSLYTVTKICKRHWAVLVLQ